MHILVLVTQHTQIHTHTHKHPKNNNEISVYFPQPCECSPAVNKTSVGVAVLPPIGAAPIFFFCNENNHSYAIKRTWWTWHPPSLYPKWHFFLFLVPRLPVDQYNQFKLLRFDLFFFGCYCFFHANDEWLRLCLPKEKKSTHLLPLPGTQRISTTRGQ